MSEHPSKHRRRSASWLAAAFLALAVVGGAFAANINGTAKNDTLRGSGKADKIFGRSGNDKLYGMGGADLLNGGPGNDLLVGGPGADVLACGPGVDTATADAADKVGADCETVTGLPKPGLSVADISVGEGNAGASAATFTVQLAKANSQKITVSFATADGTAGAGTDYTAKSGSVVFAPGETSKPVAIDILGDTAFEGDETFTLTLSSAVNAVLERASATATIKNDDVAPAAKPGHWSGFSNGGGNVQFDVLPDGNTFTNVVVNYKSQCQPPGTLTDSIKAAGPFSIQSNKTFSLVGTGSGFTILVNGTFDAAGTGVTGTFKIHDSFDYQGVHYECDTGNDAWSAKLQG